VVDHIIDHIITIHNITIHNVPIHNKRIRSYEIEEVMMKGSGDEGKR